MRCRSEPCVAERASSCAAASARTSAEHGALARPPGCPHEYASSALTPVPVGSDALGSRATCDARHRINAVTPSLRHRRHRLHRRRRRLHQRSTDARGASALMSMWPDQAFEMADGTAVSDCATPSGLSADCFTETTGTGNRCALTTTCRLQCFQSDSVLIAHVSYFGVRQWKLRLRCVQCIARA